MQLAHIATIRFSNVETGEQAAAIIRAAPGQLILSVTLETDGDVQVGMDPEHAHEFLAAVQRAVQVVTGATVGPPA